MTGSIARESRLIGPPAGCVPEMGERGLVATPGRATGHAASKAEERSSDGVRNGQRTL